MKMKTDAKPNKEKKKHSKMSPISSDSDASSDSEMDAKRKKRIVKNSKGTKRGSSKQELEL